MSGRLRIAVILPGLHRVNRGAETAFEALGRELALRPDCEVTMFGSGEARATDPYRFVSVPLLDRAHFETWPSVPLFRNETGYEEFTFAVNLIRRFRAAAFDVTLSCSYPYVNWLLRARRPRRRRMAHLFVTENGDWAPQARNREFRLFSCDGLVCTNPVYFERNRERWPSVLIPNGVDPDVFTPGPMSRGEFGLPDDRPVVLMVSALIESKRVAAAIESLEKMKAVHLAVAGDGPERKNVVRLAEEKLGERFHLLSLPREAMPRLYRSADVFLHMSKTEPSANAYIEAMATGLPIVTHDREVTRWTLEDTGHLVDTGDPDAVCSAVAEALDSDPKGRTQRQRLLVSRRYAWSSIADTYRSFMLETLADPNATHGSPA